MAQVDWPAAARIEGLSLDPSRPNRIEHEAISGDGIKLNPSDPRWTGKVRIGVLESGTAGAAAVEAFLARLGDGGNHAEIPLGSRASAFSATTVSSAAAGTLTLAAVPAGLAVNGYVRSGRRLFIVTSLAAAAREITVWPRGLIAASAEIAQAASVRARMAKPPSDFPREASGFAGPWHFDWTEAV